MNNNSVNSTTGNATLYLDAGSTVTVSRSYLNVIHETHEPEDIVFSLVRAPHLGQLLINGKPVTSFTQTDINKGMPPAAVPTAAAAAVQRTNTPIYPIKRRTATCNEGRC